MLNTNSVNNQMIITVIIPIKSVVRYIMNILDLYVNTWMLSIGAYIIH